ncbi:NAD(P)/FAD-dependent oxidoreductase [Caballeronia sp. DA-9]|uniref:NAD(P)/FAD-dependent oxidoreductase n=1 Tax=Caballeronia sp. DA-9 TaxID=3436237 RepID=UPI003F67018A
MKNAFEGVPLPSADTLAVRNRVVIIGGGQAAAQLIASLLATRQEFLITLFADEPHPPYQRPPLSKAFFSPGFDVQRLFFREESHYRESNVDLRLSTRVTAIDRERKEVVTEQGGRTAYDVLVIATGARARRLSIPGAELPGVMSLRSLPDAHAIAEQMLGKRRLVVVGGGYVGLEFAASARAAGLGVTVLETADRILARVASPAISAALTAIHRQAEVQIRTDVTVVGFEGQGAVNGVLCSDGSRVPADLVVVGIGAVPNDELGLTAGLVVDGGIVVDGFGRTSDASIFAAGDCTSTFDARIGRNIRFESVPRAMDQAKAIAEIIRGHEPTNLPPPWFWSDQHGHKLQMVGLLAGANSSSVRTVSDGSQVAFSEFYFQNDVLVAAASLNRPQEFMVARRAFAQPLFGIDRKALEDPGVPLANILTRRV